MSLKVVKKHTEILKDLINKNLLDYVAVDIKNCKEKYSITALAITDENQKPVGVLHIHDLLRAGVA